MKNLLGIMVLGLMFCNTSFADSLRVVDGVNTQGLRKAEGLNFAVHYSKVMDFINERLLFPSS